MTEEKGYLYIREHPSYNIYNSCKIGITKNIVNRNNQYITGEIKKGIFTNIFEISKVEMKNIENMLKIKFDYLHIYVDGGTEFFNKSIIEYVEPFLKKYNFEYKKLSDKEIENLTRPKKENKIIPRFYQDDIIQQSISYFENKDKGILVLPCGVGKTLISMFIIKKLNINTILIGIPNIKLLEQWLSVVKNIFIDVPYLKVFGDICVLDIENFLLNKNRYIVITTYQSVYKVKKATENTGFIFGIKILDEVHHLTTNDTENIEDTKKYVNILLIKSFKQLSLTATLKQLEINDDKKTISNNSIEYFGDIIDRKCLLWSIKNNIVCDYNIQTIVTNDKHINIYDDIKNDNDKKLFLSSFATLKSIYDKDTTHLLVYSNSRENSKKIINYIERLLDDGYFNIEDKKIDIYYSEYNSNIDMIKQENILKKFNKSKFGVLCCVYCLGEGYDNNIIDGVVFSENMTSNIRIVQSALRACRKNKLNNKKISKIILPILNKDEWLDNNENTDYKNTREIIYQMGLEDETIDQKIKVYNISIKKQKYKETTIDDGYNKDLTDDVKKFALKTMERKELSFVSYEKAINIIKNKNITSKDKYYKLCEIDDRLPKNPEKIYKNIFSNWIDYLSIEKKYYNIEECKKKVSEYIEKNTELKKYITMDKLKIIIKICDMDKNFPPYTLWCEYYDINDLSEIIYKNKKKHIVV